MNAVRPCFVAENMGMRGWSTPAHRFGLAHAARCVRAGHHPRATAAAYSPCVQAPAKRPRTDGPATADATVRHPCLEEVLFSPGAASLKDGWPVAYFLNGRAACGGFVRLARPGFGGALVPGGILCDCCAEVCLVV
jgi:hypothetical protein